MKGGSKLFIFAGVGLAVVAILLFVTSMKSKSNADEGKAQEATTVSVVQAKGNIPAHRILTINDLVQIEMDPAEVPADAITKVVDAVGQSYRVDLKAGQTVLRTQLEVPGLRNDIAPGKRAIALPVNSVSAMSGLVQDGDYVDIIFKARIDLVKVENADKSGGDSVQVEVSPEATAEPTQEPVEGEEADANATVVPGDGNTIGNPGTEFFIRDDIGDVAELEAVAKIMLQDIRIMRVVQPGETFSANGTSQKAVAEGANPGSNSSALFILEVTPEQAELVTFIQDHHQEYQIVVRNKDDHETATTTGITYQILATDEEWALPWPKSVVAPEEEEDSKDAASDDKANEDDKSAEEDSGSDG